MTTEKILFMKFLITLRNKIEDFMVRHARITGYCLRLVITFLSLVIIQSKTGYNTILSNILVIILFSVACAFIPLRFLLFVLLAYLALQVFAISVGVAVVMVVILLLMYMIYFRFRTEYAYIIVLLPILYIVKIPLIVPLVLAVVAPLSSMVPVIFGTVIYYMVHYINVNATVFSESAGTDELTKVSIFLEGTFTSAEFLCTLAVVIIIMLVVYFAKGINVEQSNDKAVIGGAGLYIILMLASNLIFGEITEKKIVAIVVGAVISAIIAELIHNIILPLDYKRTSLLQIEDEEYYYYVRAVPKATMGKESLHINKINTRNAKGTNSESNPPADRHTRRAKKDMQAPGGRDREIPHRDDES